MTTCPRCSHSAHPGYLNDKRCEVCRGWGITTLLRIMSWELS